MVSGSGVADQEEMRGVAVALLRAYQLGDEEAFDVVLSGVDDPRALAALLVGMLDTTGVQAAGGRDEWRRQCAAWQPGRGIGGSSTLDGER